MRLPERIAQRYIVPSHVALRNKKTGLFFEQIGPGLGKGLLDVGGGVGIAGEFVRLYGRFESVTVLNLEPDISGVPAHLRADAVRADGLPFQTKSVDWIFSNAVIEPVSVQRRLARFSPGYLTRYEEINLLSANDLQRLFPEAKVSRMGVPVYANAQVVACKADRP